MKSCHLLPAIAFCGLVLSSSSSAEEPTDDEIPPCNQLMAAVRMQLPREPIVLSGELIVRKRRGVVVSKCAFTIELEWGSQPPRAQYTLHSLLGTDLEQLTVIRRPGGDAQLAYATGDPLAPAPIPDLLSPIQKTDLTWTDLTLSFLWWKGGTVRGMEKIRSFNCYVVDVPAPGDKPGPYTHARLWIDRKALVLLQAEGWHDKQLVRRLWVKSVKQIKNAAGTDRRWMIKDMEIQSFPSHQRTKLRVRDVAEKTEI